MTTSGDGERVRQRAWWTRPVVGGLKVAVVALALILPATAGAANCTKRTTGTCKDPKTGQTVKLVNRAQMLGLKSVAVKIIGKSVATQRIGPFSPSHPDEVATAAGRYVSFVVKVTNLRDSPLDTVRDLDFNLVFQTAHYDQALEAENLIGAPSLVHAGKHHMIQPGQSSTGYIAFDVAPNRAPLVRKNANLLVVDNSDTHVVGLIRTYR
jgi:hypothetical protein